MGVSLQYAESCIYTVQEKAWIDKTNFSTWIQRVWMPFSNGKEFTYLIMDEYAEHKCSEYVQQIQSYRTDVGFILGGYTGKLKLVDVGINRPFKAYVRNKYEQFMVSKTTQKKPTRLDVAAWIAYAWRQIRA